jgi:uncharacterized protein YpuA (DUF1002 family)
MALPEGFNRQRDLDVRFVMPVSNKMVAAERRGNIEVWQTHLNNKVAVAKATSDINANFNMVKEGFDANGELYDHVVSRVDGSQIKKRQGAKFIELFDALTEATILKYAR